MKLMKLIYTFYFLFYIINCNDNIMDYYLYFIIKIII